MFFRDEIATMNADDIFSKSALWYDAIYAWKDYRTEASKIVELVREYRPEANSILDVACGSGQHDRFLAEQFEVDGLDINQEFVRLAQERNRKGSYQVGDMTRFELGKTYDVVICLFSSIGYARTKAGLDSTLRCFRQHLNAGGVAIVEPWLTPERWNPGIVQMTTAESSGAKICRMTVGNRDGDDSVLLFHYLVGSAKGVNHFTEEHRLHLFTREEMNDAFAAAGFAVDYRNTGLIGRGLYIGRVG